jgi:hypothetical protein
MVSTSTQIGSEMDPTGSVFEENDYVLRGIHQEFAGYYSSLLENLTIRKLLGGKIVETEIDADGLAGYPLTFRHRKISPRNYPFEWSALMLQDAALLTLDLCGELAGEGLVLKDATPWNILYDAAKPVFVDFTSIMPQDKNLLWVAYDQFLRLFLFPLLVTNSTSARVGRALLMDSANGITDSELVKLLPSGYWMRKPWLIQRLYMPRMLVSLVRQSGTDKNLKELSSKMQPGAQQREKFFTSLQKDVQTLRPALGRSRWSQYYADINSFFDSSKFNKKQAAVALILHQYKPESVVDIGCNQGGYSILAAQAGSKVIAFDNDEDSVNLLYLLVKEKGLNILPLVMDALTPSPQCGWRAIQFEAAPKRFKSTMAFALALVHHLAITQVQTFERIVQTLDDYTDQFLLTEFVPINDPRSVELMTTNIRDMSWYTLDNFLDALRKVYPEVQTFPSYPEGRTLCFCKK